MTLTVDLPHKVAEWAYNDAFKIGAQVFKDCPDGGLARAYAAILSGLNSQVDEHTTYLAVCISPWLTGMGPPMTTVKLQPVRRAASPSTASKYDGSVLMALACYISNHLHNDAKSGLTLDTPLE